MGRHSSSGALCRSDATGIYVIGDTHDIGKHDIETYGFGPHDTGTADVTAIETPNRQ